MQILYTYCKNLKNNIALKYETKQKYFKNS